MNIPFSNLYNAAKGNKTKFRRDVKALDNSVSDASINETWDILKNAYNAPSISSTADSGNILSGIFNSQSGGGNIFSTILTKFNNNVIKNITGKFGDVYDSQIGQKTNVDNDLDVFKKLINIGKNDGFKNMGITGAWEALGEVRNSIINYMEQESKLLYDINSQTSLTGTLSKIVREELIESSIAAAEFGYTLEDIAGLYVGLVNQSGKFSLINEEIIEQATPLASTLAMSMSEFSTLIGDFEKVGVGAGDTMTAIDKIYKNSLSLGLSSKKTITDIQQNIDKLNQYGFKNGVEGLSKMVQKSTEFKMSMQSVYGIAEKVFSPEGAIELAANLQVLGGAIGDFNDPLKLMYMANNDIGGIQDAIIGLASSLATYNDEQDRFEVTGLNLMRARELSKLAGIDLNELNKIAVATAERTRAATMLNSTGLNIDDEQMEFITNLARMDGGEMKIMLPKNVADELGVSTKLALDALTDDTIDRLFDMQDEFKKLSIEDIAKNQLTETQKMARDMAVVGSYYRVVGAKMLKGAAKGAGGDTLIDDLRYNINEYKENVLKKTTGNIENDTMKWTKGKIEEIKSNPTGVLKDITIDLYNEMMKFLKEKGIVQNSTNINVLHEFKSTGAVMDQILRAARQDPTYMSIFSNEYKKRSFTRTT